MFIHYREPCLSREVHFSDLFPFVRNGPTIFSDLSSLTVLNHSGIIFLRQCYVLHFIHQFLYLVHMRKPSSVSVLVTKESQVNPNTVSKKALLFAN